MQATKALLALLSMFLISCQRQEAAEEAIARSRHSLLDQVNAPGPGLPFFSPKALNPTWDAEAAIVRIPPFALRDQNGKAQDESLFQGQPTMVAFAFTSCSGFCPFVIQKLKKIKTPGLRYVVISVDPEYDSPERLKAFAKAHAVDLPNWTFLTGEVATINSLIKDTFASQVFPRPNSAGRDFVHAGHFYLVDAQGRLRAILNGTETDVAVKADSSIKQL